MSAALSDIFATFATLQNGAAYDVLVNSVMPKLSEGLMMIRTDPLSPATSSAMDFVESILGARPAELGPGLFASIAPALFDVLHVSEDRGVIQAGLHALTLVARKDVKQLLAWSVATALYFCDCMLILRVVGTTLRAQQDSTTYL